MLASVALEAAGTDGVGVASPACALAGGAGTVAGGLATAVAVGQTNITATLSGVTSNSFQLTVLAGTPASISVYGGSAQSAIAGTAFAGLLQAVVKDAGGNPISNAPVTFTAPSSGAGGAFSNGLTTCTAATNSSGIATSLALSANSTAGAYSVTAAVSGVAAAATFSLTNVKAPALMITETPMNTFVQGQNAIYSVTVGNPASAGPTSGTVTVTEAVPPGLILTGLNGGSTWNCSVPSASCSTNAVLNPGFNYPSITITLAVPYNSPAASANDVSVSGGGSAKAIAIDPTPILNACTVTQDNTTTVADVQMIINEALGVASSSNDLNGDGVINVVDLQIVVNSAMGQGCSASQ